LSYQAWALFADQRPLVSKFFGGFSADRQATEMNSSIIAESDKILFILL